MRHSGADMSASCISIGKKVVLVATSQAKLGDSFSAEARSQPLCNWRWLVFGFDDDSLMAIARV